MAVICVAMPAQRSPAYLREVLAAQVRSRRLARGESQEQLAERCGLHRTYLSGIERATRNVSLATLELLAAGLECDPAQLLIRPRRRGSLTTSGGFC